ATLLERLQRRAHRRARHAKGRHQLLLGDVIAALPVALLGKPQDVAHQLRAPRRERRLAASLPRSVPASDTSHGRSTRRATQWCRIWSRKRLARSLLMPWKKSAVDASSTIRPDSMNTTRSATRRANAIS